MGEPALRRATYEDLLAAPENMIAEIIDGELHLLPRPAVPHASTATSIISDLHGPFGRRRGSSGPGGWWILIEPELHMGQALGYADPRTEVIVPDVAGWRRERMPVRPDAAAIEIVPDWTCEIVSPKRAFHDRVRKLNLYARLGVPHYWLVDPQARTLEVLRLDGQHYKLMLAVGGDEPVRAEPFDAIEVDLGEWWIERSEE